MDTITTDIRTTTNDDTDSGSTASGPSGIPAGGLVAVPLGDAPEVEILLAGLGLGAFVGLPAARPGRNDNWCGPTGSGAEVFVKKLRGPAPQVAARMSRVAAAEAVCGPVVGLHLPTLLGTDDDAALLAFTVVPEATDAGTLARAGDLGVDRCQELGVALAALHGAEVPAAIGLTRRPSALPPLGALEALPADAYVESSAAELECWSLLQQDTDLIRGLTALSRSEHDSPGVPIHGDMRLDQWLLTDSTTHLCDWEEFRLGDAARDVGALIGEWLHTAVLRIPRGAGEALEHQDVLERGEAELDRIAPQVAGFSRGYRETAAPMDAAFLSRVAGFAGWHLIDRMLAAAHERARLQPINRAAAGIGRNAVLHPEGFATTIGLELG